MSKYFCCYFCNFEELQSELKKVTKKYDALVIAQSLEARMSPSHWIREVYKKYYELKN